MARTAKLATVALIVFGQGHFSLTAGAEDAVPSTVKVRAEGFGAGEGRAALSEALADAEVAAVEILMLDIAGGNWANKLEPVYAQIHNYVRTSRPLETQETARGVEVVAEVYVYEAQLRRDIAAVLFRIMPAKPRVVLLLGESIEGYRDWAITGGTARAFFEGRMRDAGFDVIDPVATQSRYTPEDLLEYQTGSPARIAAFGRDTGADIVIRGDASARRRSEPGTRNVDRVTAKIEVEVIRPSDGSVIRKFESESAVNSPDAGMGGQQAIEDAAERIVQDLLVAGVIGYATRPPDDDFLVGISLSSAGPWLTRARNGIMERFPKARLQDLHHSADEARFRVMLETDLSTLVHGLTDTPFVDFRLEVERAAGRQVDLNLVPIQ